MRRVPTGDGDGDRLRRRCGVTDMLYKQLVAAIGKVVQPIDFQAYARFHMRKLYRSEYQPRPFSYAIRRAGYYPEGTLSIEAAMDDGSMAEPIHTVCASSARAARPMHFALDASTRVTFGGERYVHGWINQQFSGQSGLKLNLVRTCHVCCCAALHRCTALRCARLHASAARDCIPVHYSALHCCADPHIRVRSDM